MEKGPVQLARFGNAPQRSALVFKEAPFEMAHFLCQDPETKDGGLEVKGVEAKPGADPSVG